ncbi:hypothetical protein DY000_02026960 [Brassica cretica]|uniref:Terpene synthase metal-binding domain-containing protein n=1 Tax=Brassica cretica TaxID=69181 RepID=A0ABQ7EHP2_BRACR|nr:hypothetical protein DY000_02026960 [Brassica cretica]
MQFKTHVKTNFDLAKWSLVYHVPSFEEYMEVGEVEVAVYATLASRYMSKGKMAAKEAFEWLKSRPKIVQSLCVKGRLMDDITGFQDDISRGYVTNAVSCYMKQYGVSGPGACGQVVRGRAWDVTTFQVRSTYHAKLSHIFLVTYTDMGYCISAHLNTRERLYWLESWGPIVMLSGSTPAGGELLIPVTNSGELNKMVGEADKIINEEFLTITGVRHCVLKAVIDLARMIHVCYNGYEGYTDPQGKIKEYMTSMFVDQIRL